MTGTGKTLKLTCLAALFVGIGALACGIAFVVGNLADMDAWATLCEGAVSAVYGARTAILANVPSNTAKIRTKALALTLCGLSLVAFFVFGGQDVQMAQIVFAALIVVCAVVGLALAHAIVREQLRK